MLFLWTPPLVHEHTQFDDGAAALAAFFFRKRERARELEPLKCLGPGDMAGQESRPFFSTGKVDIAETL